MDARILYCGSGWHDAVPIFQRAISLRGVRATIAIADRAQPLAPQLADVEIVLPSNAPFGAELIAAATRLRLIQQPAVGFEAIDLAAARSRGVPVCNSPGVNADSVAQAALLLLLALARRLPAARHAFARGEIGAPSGRELTGRVLGIVGMGRSGTRLADAGRALGMSVAGVRSADGRRGFLELLARADAVSVHCPSTDATRGMFDGEAFAAMRPGALLVNVARGDIVERAALERALDGGRLAGVGLDVFWREPWDPRDPLFARDQVVVLPHVGGATDEAFARVADVIAHNVRAVLRGEPLVHRVDGA